MLCAYIHKSAASRKSFADGTEKLLLSCRKDTGAKLRHKHAAGSGCEAVVGAVKRSSNSCQTVVGAEGVLSYVVPECLCRGSSVFESGL